MSAEIEVHNVITLAGRGAVLIGYVRAGAARIGQVTVPLALGDATERRLEVIGVERPHVDRIAATGAAHNAPRAARTRC